MKNMDFAVNENGGIESYEYVANSGDAGDGDLLVDASASAMCRQ